MVRSVMAVRDLESTLAKWKANTSASADRYVQGANDTQIDPTAAAIAAIPRMRSAVLEAIDNGRVANGLRRSGRQGWLDGVTGKGRANFQSGVANADPKFRASFGPLLAFIANAQTTVRSMPNLTDADRDARALRMIQLMRSYRRGQ